MKNILKNCFCSRIVMLFLFIFGIHAFAPTVALAGDGDTYEVDFYCDSGELATKPDGNVALFMQELDDPADFDCSVILAQMPTTCDGKEVLTWKSGSDGGLNNAQICDFF